MTKKKSEAAKKGTVEKMPATVEKRQKKPVTQAPTPTPAPAVAPSEEVPSGSQPADQQQPDFQITQYHGPAEIVSVAGSVCPRTSCAGCSNAVVEVDPETKRNTLVGCGRDGKVVKISAKEWMQSEAIRIFKATGRETKIYAEVQNKKRTGRIALFFKAAPAEEVTAWATF